MSAKAAVLPSRPFAAAALAAAIGALALLGTAPAAATAEHDAVDSSCVENTCGDRCQQALAAARRATARYHKESTALAHGYIAEPVCVGVPGVAAMGYHYPNPALTRDLEVDARFPEILIYAERPNGTKALIALEYFVPVLSNGQPWMGSATEPPPIVDNAAPVLFGRTFDGPMPGHAPGMPWHYDLHVWAWEHNPAGTFVGMNPRLRCPQ